MSIQCGVCKNIMPSARFLNHRERKHSMIDHVPYAKLSDDQATNGDSNGGAISAGSSAAATAGPLEKCRFCPNRIPKGTMERHLQRCHVDCHLCGKTLLKSNRAKHMEQKHGVDNATTTTTTTTTTTNTISSNINVGTISNSSSNLPELADLSQSKSSLQSDSDESIAAASTSASPTVNLSPVFNSPSVRMPYKSYASSLSSSLSWSSLLSATTPPPTIPVSSSPLPIPVPSPAPLPAIKPSNNTHHQPSPLAAEEPNVIHVDIWQLSRYMRQGRVYKNNGWLYLRNSSTIDPK